MTNGRLPRMLRHQLLVTILVIHAEHFRYATNILVRLNQLQPLRIVAGDTRSQLPPILHVQQHPRNQSRRTVSHD